MRHNKCTRSSSLLFSGTLLYEGKCERCKSVVSMNSSSLARGRNQNTEMPASGPEVRPNDETSSSATKQNDETSSTATKQTMLRRPRAVSSKLRFADQPELERDPEEHNGEH